MLKWRVSALLTVIFGVAGVEWGYAQQKKAIGFFELRIYTARPGKRDALAARFADRTLRRAGTSAFFCPSPN